MAKQFSQEDIDQYMEMKSYTIAEDDTPDGAFFAMAEEVYGWSVEDWVWFHDIGPEMEKLLSKKK